MMSTIEPLKRYGLSKSKLAMFEQCAKRLWLSVHRRELATHNDISEARFATGHEVGALACSLLPSGVMVEAEPDLHAALELTQVLLARRPRQPIFEATLQYDGLLVRIDILEPMPGSGWKIAEVKSTSGAKDHHLGDLATQVWVARKCGLKIRSACIRHVDTTFVLKRAGDYRGLFRDAELMDKLEEVVAARSVQVNDARKVLAHEEPQLECGDHCSVPFTCEFNEYCHSHLPPSPEWTVDVLCNGGGKKWRAKGYERLDEIEPELITNSLHQRIYNATLAGLPFHDAKGAKAAMRSWAFPRTWLDFETIAFVIPRWIGTRSYQQVPFQFSAHVEKRSGTIEHKEFLSIDGKDPRRACAEALIRELPRRGAVISYNASFERQQLVGLARAFPDLTDELQAIAERLVDLLPVARAHWYHRDQRGSWSIKAVLPTLSDLDYSSLEVGDGGSAQEAYLEAICPECSDDRRLAISAALKEYCKLDTEAMIVVARALSASESYAA
jgi:hypothetical protein